MRTDYIKQEELRHLLAALMPENRLALEISLSTGLRIGDVLALRADDLRHSRRLTVRELKTGKNRAVTIPAELQRRALVFAGKVYVFEHRHDWKRHRTRQAVYKDIKRVARIFRLELNVAPHTARKVYAVEQYKRDGNLKRVQQLLNHSSESVTLLYALADQLVEKHKKRP